MSDDKFQKTLLHVVARLPEWIRRDLTSKDILVRTAAEETLALTIATALKEDEARGIAEKPN